jgi:uncharacterized protein YjbI with pentapeptide repeats
MANEEHLKTLKHGVEAWNSWRQENPDVIPDLKRAMLREAQLSYIDLNNADMTYADLSNANLNRAHLSHASLRGATLKRTYLKSATLSKADVSDADLSNADLSNARADRADFSRARFSGSILIRADLSDAKLNYARFSHSMLYSADLGRADLSYSHLTHADLSFAGLTYSNMQGADLTYANLCSAILEGAILTKAMIGWTVFANVDLSPVKELDTLKHVGPSFISIDTLYRSGGNIPPVFLHGCGVPDDLASFLPSVIDGEKALELYSCFISYSNKDEEFAKRLHSRLQDEQIRVWFAPEDIKGGEMLEEQIDRAIQVHDRLLIVLSRNSLQSQWVLTEIRKARKAEGKEKRRKLFPIRLVSFEELLDWQCVDADSGSDLAREVRQYFIPDFSNWKDRDSFETAFSRLLRDLKAQIANEGRA